MGIDRLTFSIIPQLTRKNLLFRTYWLGHQLPYTKTDKKEYRVFHVSPYWNVSNKKKPGYEPGIFFYQKVIGGAGGIRTHVQTYSPNAFYMLILELIVRKQQGPNEPTVSVAEWS